MHTTERNSTTHFTATFPLVNVCTSTAYK